MKQYTPDRVIFEPDALNYPLGRKLQNHFRSLGIKTIISSIHNVHRNIPGKNEKETYAAAKKTLVVRPKKSLSFDVCKPSADYEFPLVTNCPGSCEYCYLQTTQGKKPYLTVYVNIDEILAAVLKHIDKNNGQITTFEVASTGDPLSLEHLTGSLAKTIEFFGTLENGRLRVVTKFDNADPLLNLRHNGHTRFRVSINARYVIKNFEHNTASFDERIEEADKISSAGYPIGFIVAPIMVYEDWQMEYRELFDRLKSQVDVIKSGRPVTFELIQHRFTPIAKGFILNRFPNTKLDMDETRRSMKWGKYGKFKYVYPKETSQEIKEYISSLIYERFPAAQIDYFT
ncbi:MAG: spore photoproduct lyase [Syntrophomonadaceae bacterium]|jgi:spore photoproduct lyase|nr:spore photoproduct lyase [Syntrophomonadaceae bacterium]